MKLLNSLYSVINEYVTTDEHSFIIKLDASHFIYAAHFPGEPITPGVCIMQIAQELIELHMGCSINIKTVKNIKFLRVIIPTQTPIVNYTLSKIASEDGCVKAQVVVSTEEGVFAKLSLVCQICA